MVFFLSQSSARWMFREPQLPLFPGSPLMSSLTSALDSAENQFVVCNKSSSWRPPTSGNRGGQCCQDPSSLGRSTVCCPSLNFPGTDEEWRGHEDRSCSLSFYSCGVETAARVCKEKQSSSDPHSSLSAGGNWAQNYQSSLVLLLLVMLPRLSQVLFF